MVIRIFAVVSGLLAGALPAATCAAILLINDPTLPASGDGFNITRDTETGLDWLDIDVTVGRTFNDLTGGDGSNEFLPGGDFPGFRYARQVEVTGAQNGPQLPSLYRSLGISPFDYSSIGGYAVSRAVISIGGCLGACAVNVYFPNVPAAAYGYLFGTVLNNNGVTPALLSIETFRTQGFNWGRSEPFGAPAFVGLLPPNNLPLLQGNWLVRASPIPLPAPILLLLGGLIGLALRVRPR